MADIQPDTRSLPQLVSDLTSDLTTLFRKEIQLARAEISDKARQFAKGLSVAAIGAVLLVAALIFLLEALVIALADVMGPVAAALTVGVVLAVIGVIAMRAGMKNTKPEALKPERTMNQVQEDARLAKGQMK